MADSTLDAVIRIDDPADPRIGDYRDVRERDLVGRRGCFVAEGRVVLEQLLAHGRHPLRSVLLAESRLPGFAPSLGALPSEVPIYAASQAVMDAIVGFPIHRGVLAIGEAAPANADELLARLPEQALVMGLVGIANHDNMGGLFRNAAAFGVDAVLLDETCCDPLYRKAIRVSVGAVLSTPFARVGSDLALLARLRQADFAVAALSPAGSVKLSDWRPAPRTAVLFGAEGPGLAAAVLTQATTVRIPMAGGFDSLNVGTTSGIVLHHVSSLR